MLGVRFLDDGMIYTAVVQGSIMTVVICYWCNWFICLIMAGTALFSCFQPITGLSIQCTSWKLYCWILANLVTVQHPFPDVGHGAEMLVGSHQFPPLRSEKQVLRLIGWWSGGSRWVETVTNTKLSPQTLVLAVGKWTPVCCGWTTAEPQTKVSTLVEINFTLPIMARASQARVYPSMECLMVDLAGVSHFHFTYMSATTICSIQTHNSQANDCVDSRSTVCMI